MHRTTALASSALLAGAVLLGACGDDESAGDRVCEDRSDVRDGLSELVDDVAAGNFGEAQDELSDVEEDLRELQDSFSDLSAEEREQLQPEIDELESQVRALGDAESMDDLSAGADDVVSTLDSILGQIGDSLSC